MTYSNAQLQALARSVGIPENHVPLMAAIALAESSGDPSAINPGVGAGGRRTNEYSVGLWQINTLVHKNYSVQQLKDPQINAREMARIYRTQGLRAWGAYTDGRYKRYMTGVIATGSPLPSSSAASDTSKIVLAVAAVLVLALLIE